MLKDLSYPSLSLEFLSLGDVNLDAYFLSRMSPRFSSEYTTSKCSPRLQKFKRNNKLVRGNKREK